MAFKSVQDFNTLVACRVPKDYQRRVKEYANRHDLNVSQVVRRGLNLVLESEVG
jgi:hypothetical protein